MSRYILLKTIEARHLRTALQCGLLLSHCKFHVGTRENRGVGLSALDLGSYILQCEQDCVRQ
jgi:hypothetical protein